MLLTMRPGARGFSLVEVVVALAIVAMLLLAASRIYWQQREVSNRMSSQRAADRALENLYEVVRANPALLVDATYPQGGPDGLVVTLKAESAGAPGLTRVDLVASYRVRGHPFRRSLVAMVYAP